MRPALDRRPAEEDYLLCHTGTLALRVHVVMPGRLHQTFICCVCIDNSIVRCIAQFSPPATYLASRWRITKAVYTLTILPDARTVRERFASGCPCTHCVHCVGFVRYTQTTSGCVRSGRERFASAWLCRVNARVDASDASGRERRTVCPCLLTDLSISTDTIHMTRKGDICHELSTCNWATTGREADAVCTRRSVRVPLASGQSVVA